MKNLTPEDLDWLAFRYIAGELSASEADAFETRMADNQEAREAVVRAVDLACGLAATVDRTRINGGGASPASNKRRRTGTARLLAWATVAAVACLAVVAHRSFRSAAPQPELPQELATEGQGRLWECEPQQLALLWSRTREEVAALQFAEWTVVLDGEVDAFEEISAFPAEDVGGHEPPSWMLAAVQAGLGVSDAEEYGPSIPQEN